MLFLFSLYHSICLESPVGTILIGVLEYCAHFLTCSKWMDFFSEFWDFLGMCAERHTVTASVQWECNERLILSCFLCSCQEWSQGFFPLSCLQWFITLLKTMIFLKFFFWEEEQLICLLSWSSENTGVYLSFAQHAEYSWNRSFCPLPNVKLWGRRVNLGGGLLLCLGETVIDVVWTTPQLALLDKCEIEHIKMELLATTGFI